MRMMFIIMLGSAITIFLFGVLALVGYGIMDCLEMVYKKIKKN